MEKRRKAIRETVKPVAESVSRFMVANKNLGDQTTIKQVFFGDPAKFDPPIEAADLVQALAEELSSREWFKENLEVSLNDPLLRQEPWHTMPPHLPQPWVFTITAERVKAGKPERTISA